MSRRRYVFDERKVIAYQEQGRGQGWGPDYQPWLRIQDVPSRGRSHRPHGVKTRRAHHFLSDGEWRCFLMFEASPLVLDIREQFPLDRVKTLQAATNLGFRHPVTLDGTPYVMTIDFLVTAQVAGAVELQPYTFKYDPRTLERRDRELLEIATEFWRGEGYQLKLIDQSFFDENLIRNYDLVRSFYDISGLAFCATTDVAAVAAALRRAVAAFSELTLADTCRLIARQVRAEDATVMQIAKHLIVRRVLLANLSSPIRIERMRMRDFELSPDAEG